MKASHLASISIPLLVLAVPLAARAQGDTGATAPPPANTTAPPATTTAAPTAAPPAPAHEHGAQMDNGFVLETHVYSQLVGFGAGLGTTINLPLVTGGLFAGYKLERLIIGLGYDFSSCDAGGARIVMRWVPGIRYAFARSTDERVELFGQADLGFGHDFGSSQANEIIDVDLGLGARYWVHPQFAIAAVGGWNGDWNLGQTPTTSVVLMGIFAGLQVTGVF